MLVDDFDEAGNDGERAVDVMNDARVNLSFGPHNLLLDFLIVQFALQLMQSLVISADFFGEQMMVHGAGNGGAHG